MATNVAGAGVSSAWMRLLACLGDTDLWGKDGQERGRAGQRRMKGMLPEYMGTEALSLALGVGCPQTTWSLGKEKLQTR